MADTKETPHQADIIIVDDVPENLHVLSGMLKSQNYKVRPFPSGKLAIRAAEAEAPDLILLDIMMPEMDGYEVCRRLKEVEDLKDVPIIFISALTETKDIVKAFSMGGVDYVTKPFEFEEVRARVDTHLKIRSLQIELEKKHRQLEENYEQLRRLEARERELLEKTLSGSIKVLAQILSIAKPAAFGKSARIARLMRSLAVELGIPTWEFELAGRLSQIGCVILPDQLVNKIARGEALVNVESAVFSKHPEVARELLVNIPHLEKIAEIVAQQLEQPPEEGEKPAIKAKPAADTVVSARALQMVLECDRLTSAGKTTRSAIGKIK
ncbi:MAG: response regulator, partial [Planctomycetota bacterium]|nr:response regulator [Planctomycetota bacterium]